MFLFFSNLLSILTEERFRIIPLSVPKDRSRPKYKTRVAFLKHLYNNLN